MARPAASIGDNRCGSLHDRLPVRIRHIGDQHLTRFEQMHVSDRRQHPCRARPDLLPYGTSLDDNRSGLANLVPLQTRTALPRLHGLRTGLEDVELAVLSVLAPLDVHWSAVML